MKNKTESNLQIKEILKQGREGYAIFNEEILSKIKGDGFKAVVFDFDGVLLKEIGVAEKGYAWVIRAIRDGSIQPHNIDVLDEDVIYARNFRHQIKGKSITEKISIFNKKFAPPGSNVSNKELITGWYDFLKNYLSHHFLHNPSVYCIPGAKQLISLVSKQTSVFGLTANEHEHAHWLMEFVGLENYFEHIVGFPAFSEKQENKGTLLADLLKKYGILQRDACYIGDGASDVKAGVSAGTLTIGIANNETPVSHLGSREERTRIIEKSIKNGMQLLETGCDLLATSTIALLEIAPFFGKQKMVQDL